MHAIIYLTSLNSDISYLYLKIPLITLNIELSISPGLFAVCVSTTTL